MQAWPTGASITAVMVGIAGSSWRCAAIHYRVSWRCPAWRRGGAGCVPAGSANYGSAGVSPAWPHTGTGQRPALPAGPQAPTIHGPWLLDLSARAILWCAYAEG